MENIFQNLINELDNDNAETREESALKLAGIGDPSAIQYLLNRLKKEENLNVITVIIYALGEIESKESIGTLIEYSKSEISEVRWVAVEALGKISTPNISEVLINCLKDEKNSNIRAAIIHSLANFSSKRVIKTLLFYLKNDEDDSVKQEAYLSLKKINITIFENSNIVLEDSLVEDNNSINNAPKVLIDASLILDFLLERDSIYLNDAKKIMKLIFSKSLNAYISKIGFQYILNTSKDKGDREETSSWILNLLGFFNVCDIDRSTIDRACNYYLNSFETGIQVECAKQYNLDAIITLRSKDFLGCGWKNVFPPSQFIQFYAPDNLSRNYNSLIIESYKQHLKSLDFPDGQNSTEKQLYLFAGWKIEYFDLLCSKNNWTTATVTLSNQNNKDYRYSESAFGNGSITILFAAFDKVIYHIMQRHSYTLESINFHKLEGGLNDNISALVSVKYNDYIIRMLEIDDNIINASFYAYVKAVIEIYNIIHRKNIENKISINKNYQETSPFSKTQLLISQEQVLAQYKIGERDFSQANLRNADFTNEFLSGVSFQNCDLRFSKLEGVQLFDANLQEAIFDDADLFHADLQNVNMSESSFRRSKLNKANLTNANLSNADLSEVILDNAVLRNTNLNSVVLTKGILSESCLTNTIFWKAILIDANFSRADLTGADLTGADLTGADLTGADLTGADLTGADLTGADLTGAELNLAKSIDGVNFSNANLSEADLSGLDLNKTIFSNPILTNANMSETKFEICGYERIERTIQLFTQFMSNELVVYAVHSSSFAHSWWNNDSDIVQKFRQVNKELSEKGVILKRVFIIPKHEFLDGIKEILKEQVSYGIEVRFLYEENLVDSCNELELRKNLLVCKNLSVPENSFTTMMLVNNGQEKETGYISFKKVDIQTDEQRFTMIWEKAIPFGLTARKGFHWKPQRQLG